MEQLLHYVWKHKIFPLRELKLSDGRQLEVINPGIHNTNAGPDFLEAKIKIDDTVWAGNVEIHTRTSDWFRHHHDTNPIYDNIILHVTADIDCQLFDSNGREIPQVEVAIPQYVKDNYEHLAASDVTPRCRNILSSIPTFNIHSWMSYLQVERLEERTSQLLDRRERLNQNWEDTFFVTLARSFGFGKNGDAFEQWAHSIPMGAVGKHRDNLFQIEAIFFGQAGLLDEDSDNLLPQNKEYYLRLQREYRYLRQKFSLTPIDSSRWKFLRLRPQNFPHIRIAQLAMLYYSQSINLSKVLSAESVDEIAKLLDTHVSDFWQTHFNFHGEESASSDKQLSKAMKRSIIINCIIPTLFAYGRYKRDEPLCQKAFGLWEALPAEANSIVQSWIEAGISPQNAADSQALIQLTKHYCIPHDCLRCRFGHEFIRSNPGFLREKN